VGAIFRTQAAPPKDALRVKVIGHQWWWEFRYPELGITTANELWVPVNRPVALAMTTADVIHSFWIPRLAGKRDVIAGRVNRIAFTADSVGAFLGQCAEFCGESHANMRLRVMVATDSGFRAWAVRQGAAPAPLGLRYTEPPALGDFNLRLAAPGPGNTGSVLIDATVPSWLRYDWDAGALGDENPVGQATFGIFGGESRQIYTREIY